MISWLERDFLDVLSFRNETKDKLLASRVTCARGFVDRLSGLLVAPKLAPGEGLWLMPCRMIHTWGMRYSLDILFLDADLRVVGSCEQLTPFRLSPLHLRARSVLELVAGTISSVEVQIGDQLSYRSV